MSLTLPLLPTTLVGSLPQPEWLIDRQKLGNRLPPRVRLTELWRVAPEFLEQAQDDATILAIRAQERAGLDIITDGEMRRESYSNRFATALEGVDIDNPGPDHQPFGQAGHRPARDRENPAQTSRRSTRRRIPAKKHGPPDQDHGARPFHDGAAGAERLLQDGRRNDRRLRRGGK